MHVIQAIQERRAFRSLAPVKITKELVEELAKSVQLSPSCFNSQPWRLVFVSNPGILEKMFFALTEGNAWARSASLIIAVFSRQDDDCVIRDRVYHQFDTGMGIGFLLLRATELGLVAHPIAGFSPKKTRALLRIPDDYQVITLIIVGRHADSPGSDLTEEQLQKEKKRPGRKALEEFLYIDRFGSRS
ncbi:MAG: nitroreductase family protein [Candidatus Aminicenantaceae bacterium]